MNCRLYDYDLFVAIKKNYTEDPSKAMRAKSGGNFSQHWVAFQYSSFLWEPDNILFSVFVG